VSLDNAFVLIDGTQNLTCSKGCTTGLRKAVPKEAVDKAKSLIDRRGVFPYSWELPQGLPAGQVSLLFDKSDDTSQNPFGFFGLAERFNSSFCP
jgi:hypothetical protein